MALSAVALVAKIQNIWVGKQSLGIRTYAAQGGDTPQDTPKDNNRRRKDHTRHHNDMHAHMEQDGAELVQKTVRSTLGDLIYFA